MTQPEIYEHRHSFVVSGVVDRDAFVNVAVKATNADSKLKWYIHAHSYSDFNGLSQCPGDCILIHEGNVTRTEQLTPVEAQVS